MVVSLFLIAGCDFLFADEEITKIVKIGDPNLCKDLEADTPKKTQDRQDECYLKVAVEVGKPYICEEIKDDYDSDKCYGQIAVKTKNEELCEKVEKKEKCYNDVAVEKLDISICSKAGNKENSCITKIAEKAEKKEYCFDLEPVGDADNCLLKVVAKTGDYEICSLILSSIDKKKECILSVAKVTKDPKLCEQLIHDKRAEDCWFSVAEKDYDYCKKINDIPKRDRCYLNAVQASGTAPCNEISTEEGKLNCFFTVAKNKDLPDECYWAPDEMQGDCFEKFSKLRKDAHFCEFIKQKGTRDKCIHNIAVFYKDTKVCDNLEDAAEKNACMDSTTRTVLQE